MPSLSDRIRTLSVTSVVVSKWKSRQDFRTKLRCVYASDTLYPVKWCFIKCEMNRFRMPFSLSECRQSWNGHKCLRACGVLLTSQTASALLEPIPVTDLPFCTLHPTVGYMLVLSHEVQGERLWAGSFPNRNKLSRRFRCVA